jgi:hypothetical protein
LYSFTASVSFLSPISISDLFLYIVQLFCSLYPSNGRGWFKIFLCPRKSTLSFPQAWIELAVVYMFQLSFYK